jgi:serine/threonine-protein kinase
MLSKERWAQVKRIFDRAIDLGPEGRASFLDSACAGDASLRAEVETLLASDNAAGGFLEAAPPSFLSPGAGTPHEGQNIGPYRLVRVVGRGGMGTVFVAERADAEYRKEVAVKVVNPGPDAREIVLRFRHERQTLAALDHPNIARLLDWGTTSEGVPFFVMDYVDGAPLDEYCDAHRLGIDARLALMLTVCSAVSYAHQNLTVHRDLKPDNILVTTEGVAKLVDFGIAKVLGPGPSPQTRDLTRAPRRMTPEYASPEQVRGGPITTASDIYSLGVLLYRLLAGRRPYRLTGLGLEQIEKTICEVEPPRPSVVVETLRTERSGDEQGHQTPEAISEARGTTPPGLRRRLAGDLDRIVLKALEKDPQRRYQSVERLAEDIRRHLTGLPVSARSPTLWYRGAKFVRRHRVGVAAAAIIVVSLLAAVTTIASLSVIAARERQTAQRVSSFLRSILASADVGWFGSASGRGQGVTVAQMLGEAARRADSEFADAPEIQAGLRRTIGNTYHTLGMFDAAETQLRAALGLHLEIFDAEHLEVATSLHDLASLLMFKGDYEESERLFRQALAIQRRAPADPNAVVRTLGGLGSLLDRRGDPSAAEPILLEALGRSRELVYQKNEMSATMLVLLGRVHEDLGDVEGAESRYQEALQVLPIPPGGQSLERGILLANLAALLAAKGDYGASETLFRDALDRIRAVVGERHWRYASGLVQLAHLSYLNGDYESAERQVREGLDVQRRSFPARHPEIAQSVLILGATLTRRGEAARAEPLLREGLDIGRRSLTAGHWLRPALASALGECLTAQQRYAEALPLLEDGHAGLEATLGARHPRTRDGLARLVKHFEATHQPEKAAAYRARLARAGGPR